MPVVEELFHFRVRATLSPVPEIPGGVGAHRARFVTGSAEGGCHTAEEQRRGPNARLVLPLDVSTWRCWCFPEAFLPQIQCETFALLSKVGSEYMNIQGVVG